MDTALEPSVVVDMLELAAGLQDMVLTFEGGDMVLELDIEAAATLHSDLVKLLGESLAMVVAVVVDSWYFAYTPEMLDMLAVPVPVAEVVWTTTKANMK